jgi:hypothetical protein
MALPRQKWKFESAATCTDSDRQLERAVNTQLVRGLISAYRTPAAFGIIFSWKGLNHTVEQEQPFDADQVVAMVNEWADKLENRGLPRGWSYDPW